MQNKSLRLRVPLLVAALIVFYIGREIAQNSRIKKAQSVWAQRVQAAKLLGANKQSVVAFYKQYNLSYQMCYSDLDGGNGGGWVRMAPKVPWNRLGMAAISETKSVAWTVDMTGSHQHDIEISALFNNKGQVIGIQVMPE